MLRCKNLFGSCVDNKKVYYGELITIIISGNEYEQVSYKQVKEIGKGNIKGLMCHRTEKSRST